MNNAPLPGKGPRRPPRPQAAGQDAAGSSGIQMSPDAARLVLIQGHLESLGGCISFPELLRKSLKALVEMCDLECGFVYSAEGNAGSLSLREIAHYGVKADASAVSSSVLNHALENPGKPVVSSSKDDKITSSASVLDLQIKSYAAFSVQYQPQNRPWCRLVFYCDKKFAAQKFNNAMMNSIRNLAFMVEKLLPSALDHDAKYRTFSDLHELLNAANEQVKLVEENLDILAEAAAGQGMTEEVVGHLSTQANTLNEIAEAVGSNADLLKG